MISLAPFYAHYRSTADGPVEHLTLLHGWGLHSVVWDDLMPSLLARFQVTVVDLPGMGQSPLPNQPYTLDFLAQQVASVMPAKTHLLGWSLGGLVALTLAERLPQRVQSLATIGINPCFCVRQDWPKATPQVLLDKFSALVQEDSNGALVRFMALICNGSASQKTDIQKLKEILFFCGLPAPRALREGLEVLRQADLREALVTLAQPVQMLFGERDAIVPVAAAAAVQALAPQVDVEVLAAASHAPFIAQVDEVATRLHDFWQRHFVEPKNG